MTTQTDQNDALRCAGLRLTYRARRREPVKPALDGVDLVIPRGQMVALLGPNGSGKSTLLKIVAQLLPPDAGSVEVFGEASPNAIRRSLGVVFQSPGLDRHLSVGDNLVDQAALYGLDRREARARIDEELAAGELTDRRDWLVKALSTGLARRVDLVRALLHRPRLLLLDEPTVGLDPVARAGFLRTIQQRRQEQQITVLMSTHLVDEADQCDRVVLLHQGRCVADDSPMALRARLGRRRIRVAAEAHPAIPGLEWKQEAGGWSAALPGDVSQAAAFAGQLARDGASFSIAPPTLADVFEQLTGERLRAGEAA